MRFIPTRSTLRCVTGSTAPVRHQTGSADTSRCTPIVFIVDEDQTVSEALALLISRQGWRPETFTSAEEFLNRPRELATGCLVVEFALPGLGGLELQKRVAAERPGVPVVFLSTNFDLRTTIQAMKAGAAELFMKPIQDEELVSAIREALEWSRHAVAQEEENRALQARYASLSSRERQVMTLVTSGLLNKQVAGELGITEKTVKAHRGQVMQKMKASSLAHLVKMATKMDGARRFHEPMHRLIAGRTANLVGQLLPSPALAS